MPVIDLGSVIGPQGPQGVQGATGATGATGAAGPNIINSSTDTTLQGVLYGNNRNKVSTLSFDESPTEDSIHLISSGNVYNALLKKPGHNMLRNWYFVGGGTAHGVFPINQRGLSSYSGAVQYTIDGWQTTNTATVITVGTTGLTMSASGSQPFLRQAIGDIVLGKKLTLSIFTSTGLYSATSTLPSSTPSSVTTYCAIEGIGQVVCISGAWYVRLVAPTGGSNTYYAVKLEMGDSQSLAYSANNAWVLTELPDYDYELYKCQMSHADPNDTLANGMVATAAMIAPIETGINASRQISANTYFCWRGGFYKATTTINSGVPINPGNNCTKTTIATALQS